MIIQSLNGTWSMSKINSEEAYEAVVPTTMYEVLLAHQVIEDPFYGENDLDLTDLSNDDYRFTRSFMVHENLYDQRYIEIAFEGLDTLATICINGVRLARTNNMHRTYVFDVKSLLRLGENTIAVAFNSPTEFIKREQAKDPLWGITTTMDGYAHIRKAHHMFGWDWGPKLPDMGIWRDVTLRGYSQGKIDSIYMEQIHGNDQVELTADIESRIYSNSLNLVVTLSDPKGVTISEQTQLARPLTGVHFVVALPELWWPNNYGDQPLYEVKVQLIDEDQVCDEMTKQIGLRIITMTREKDVYGESFDLTINGKRIFAMGANYIPEDALITRPTYQDTERLITDCVKANYNCIRVWGGGVYPSDTFYDLCDRHGLIVWQDFMFACGVYRLTKTFEDNITAEFIDNIKRIRHHACLGLWCGNNEMEEAFVSWGLPTDERLRMDYLLMFEKLIPDVLEKYDPKTFYWPASPSSGGGFVDPNGDNKGDVHYWRVFHGNEHYKRFRDHYFRFASEYGMQAFPNMKTIETFADKEAQHVYGAVMENHNKCFDPLNGNIKIFLNMAGEFNLPKEFKDSVYISQVFQGETIKCAVEHYRRNRGRCMGSTYWQFNDSYPGNSWSSVDYYGRWKALHYYAKRFYKPVLLSAYESGSTGSIHLSNESLQHFRGEVRWQIRHVTLGVLESGEIPVAVEPLTSLQIVKTDIRGLNHEPHGERKLYLAYQLMDQQGEELSSDTLLFTFHKYFEFKAGDITTEVMEFTKHMEIHLSSQEYMKSVEVDFSELDVILSDNYFDLLPNRVKVIVVDEIRTPNVSDIARAMRENIRINCVNQVGYS